jgi:mxaJ protein
MSSRCRSTSLGAALAVVPLLAAGAAFAAAPNELRVCADPNDLPYSNARAEGFENKIAELLARDLGAPVAYAWKPLRRGLVRNTLSAGLCDVLMGVPAGFGRVETTAPYYRSSYVLVEPAGRQPAIDSLDDPALRGLTIGVQLVGDDGANSPPAHALSWRGLADNLRGYPVYGDYATPDPAAAIVHAVARGDVDLAVVWGPIAGYFAKTEPVPLRLTPVAADAGGPALPMSFAIAIGVRRGDTDLRDALGAALARNRAAVDAILADYGVPRLPPRGEAP